MALPLVARLTLSTAPPASPALGWPRKRLYRATERLAIQLPLATQALVLTTCGGFYHFPWPEKFEWSGNLYPSANDRNALEQAAEVQLWQLLTPDLLSQLSALTHFVSIGADSYTCLPDGRQYCCELVAVLNLHTHEVRWTGKYYPTGPWQMRWLYRCPELDSHFLSLRRHRTLVLGCHDLNLFSPRGMAVESPDGTRAKWRAAFLAEARKFAPSLVLHHPHTTQSPRVWLQAIHQLQRELPTVNQFVSGLNVYSEETCASLQVVQEKTRCGSNILEV